MQKPALKGVSLFFVVVLIVWLSVRFLYEGCSSGQFAKLLVTFFSLRLPRGSSSTAVVCFASASAIFGPLPWNVPPRCRFGPSVENKAREGKPSILDVGSGCSDSAEMTRVVVMARFHIISFSQRAYIFVFQKSALPPLLGTFPFLIFSTCFFVVF